MGNKLEFVEMYLMKYMTFNSSCSYAGIANMLERFGIDTSDQSIALGMKLPYLFGYSDGVYLSGPMLQSEEWFNLYLNPIGFQMKEKRIPAEEVIEYLKSQKTAMIGMYIENKVKHAVVYIGTESNQIIFLNNKWETEESPREIRLNKSEVKQKLESVVNVATLYRINPIKVSFTEKLRESITFLKAQLSEIIKLCYTEEQICNLCDKLNTLFRPLFLDGITMLNLIGETDLANSFTSLQHELLCALRQEPSKRIVLKEYISIDKLQVYSERYIDLIRAEIENAEMEYSNDILIE